CLWSDSHFPYMCLQLNWGTYFELHSKPINKLCCLSAEIRELTRGAPGVCSSNEITEAVLCKFVTLCADSDADESIQFPNVLQDKFCVKTGIIFAEMPCSEHVLENLHDAVNGLVIIMPLNNPLKNSPGFAKQVEKIFHESAYRQQ
uniref:Uncharacterized protein n=1 Tax=Calidris pygmaea TaxID=425635 RepID=A0A8C3KE78_9CHAR